MKGSSFLSLPCDDLSCSLSRTHWQKPKAAKPAKSRNVPQNNPKQSRVGYVAAYSSIHIEVPKVFLKMQQMHKICELSRPKNDWILSKAASALIAFLQAVSSLALRCWISLSTCLLLASGRGYNMQQNEEPLARFILCTHCTATEKSYSI